MRVQTFLPVFNGFYNTLFEDLIDNATDNAIEYYNEQNESDLNYDDFDFDFDSIINEICKDAVLKVEEYNDECLYFELCENAYFVEYTINE